MILADWAVACCAKRRTVWVPDQTVVYDDVVTHRLTACTCCSGRLSIVDVDDWANSQVVATVIICLRCKEAGAWRGAVLARMQARYDPQRYKRENSP